MEFIGLKIPIVNNFTNWAREATAIINNIMLGKTNNTGTFTLTANATSTTITLASGRLTPDSVIHWTAKTANAAGALSGMYYSVDAANNTFTVTHANTAAVDKTFSYTHVG